MLDIVPQEPAVVDGSTISRSIAQRQESTAITELQSHFERKRGWFSKLSEESVVVPHLHMLGVFGTAVTGVAGTISLFEAPNGGTVALLIGAGTIAASYASMIVSKIRTSRRTKQVLGSAEPEVQALAAELEEWLKRDYSLRFSPNSDLPYCLAGDLLRINGRVLEPSAPRTFLTESGGHFEARIVQREDGGLELHRPNVASPGEDSLIPPVRRAIEA